MLFLYFILKVDFYYQHNKFNWQTANKKIYICHYFYNKITPLISLSSTGIKAITNIIVPSTPHPCVKYIYMAMLLWDEGRTENNANHLLEDCLSIKHELLARFDYDLLFFYPFYQINPIIHEGAEDLFYAWFGRITSEIRTVGKTSLDVIVMLVSGRRARETQVVNSNSIIIVDKHRFRNVHYFFVLLTFLLSAYSTEQPCFPPSDFSCYH